MSFVIQTKNLTRSFGRHKAVDSINLNVPAGKIYGFLGRNGAGKTTTIRMLLGLIRPAFGEISILGTPFCIRNPHVLQRVGTMAEQPGFYANLSAAENLLLHASLCGVRKKNAIEESLALTGLAASSRKLVKNFSLGMKQRLGISRALLTCPELLILDEPTNGLDPAGIREMRRLLRRLVEEKEITVFLSSHILSEVEQVADWVGIIHDGRLLEEISLGDLRTRFRRFLEIQVSDDGRATVVLEERYHITDYEVLPQGIIRIYENIQNAGSINRSLLEAGIEVTRLTLGEDKLEHYFMKMTGGDVNVESR